MDKEEFIARCKKGDEYALGLLYTTYVTRMKQLCKRYVVDDALAEDIVHDGFIIIMTHIGQLNDASKIESWMAAIMRNLAIRQLEKGGEKRFVPLEQIEEDEVFAENPIMSMGDYKDLLKLIEVLPKGYKKVFKLSVLQGLSHKEIGRLLGINPHSSSSQLARAKALLRYLAEKHGFSLIVILALSYSAHLNMRKPIINRWTSTYRPTDKSHTTGIFNNRKQKKEFAQTRQEVDKEDTTYLHANKHKTDTATTVTMDNATTSIPSPRHKEYLTETVLEKPKEKNGWHLSLSYSGGTEKNSWITRQHPGDIGSSTETETVKTRQHMPLVVKLSIEKVLDKGWSVGSGLKYTLLKTDITTISENNVSTQTKKVEYVGLPIEASYTLWKNGQLSVYTKAGVAADIPLSGSHKWQWTVTTGAGMQYKLTPRLSLFAEPSMSYNINSKKSAQTLWTNKPFVITIPIGIKISW